MAEKEACTAAAAPTNNEDDEVANLEQEVTEGNWTRPEVEVHEVKVVTGEEAEDVFWKCRAKLYRWANGSEWKERGLGDAKLLQHKETKKIRFLMRQEKTLKVVANHYVFATDVYCKLTPNVSSERIWVWTVMDFAEGELKNEQFAIKFGLVEQAQEFKQKFEEATAVNSKLFAVADGDKPAGKEKEEGNEKEEKDKKLGELNKEKEKGETEKTEAIPPVEGKAPATAGDGK